MFTGTLGYLSLLLALSAALYALYCNTSGLWKKSSGLLDKGRGGVSILTFLVTLTSFILLFALVSGDFSLKYVYDYSALDLPAFYKLSAFWAGNAGSLLLWAFLLTILTAVLVYSGSISDQRMRAAVTSVMLINVIFFLVSMLFFANPFAANPQPASDGRGLNPMLRNPWMVIHPVALYLGYVTSAVPFSFAVASLFLKRGDDGWIKQARHWAVLAWLFLSLGNLFGAQWAYVELGWGGYWAWDPVENASFLPWLTGTALLHSLLVQERKGSMALWNLILVVVTYWLTLYGTFLVRSGILSSVHAFPKSNLGYWFGFFMFAMLAWAIYLIWSRRDMLREKKPSAPWHFLSKESGFLLNNILLVSGVFIIFFGTNLPLFSRMVTGVERIVGKDWFNSNAGPVLLTVILLMGLCPLLTWTKTDLVPLGRRLIPGLIAGAIFVNLLYYFGVTSLWGLAGFSVVAFVLLSTLWQFIKIFRGRAANAGSIPAGASHGVSPGVRRRLGGFIVHLGLVLLTLGVVGDAFYSMETVRTVNTGETISIGRINDYRITFQGVKVMEEGSNEVIYTDLLVSKNGKSAETLRPEHIYYPNWESPRSEVVILGGPLEDLYIVLAGWNKAGTQGTFEIHVNPLISWLWTGGYLACLGGLIVLWPGKKRNGKKELSA